MCRVWGVLPLGGHRPRGRCADRHHCSVSPYHRAGVHRPIYTAGSRPPRASSIGRTRRCMLLPHARQPLPHPSRQTPTVQGLPKDLGRPCGTDVPLPREVGGIEKTHCNGVLRRRNGTRNLSLRGGDGTVLRVEKRHGGTTESLSCGIVSLLTRYFSSVEMHQFPTQDLLSTFPSSPSFL